MGDFETALAAYVDGVQKLVVGFHGDQTTVSTERGSKNVRVVVDSLGQRSVHTFVEIATGNILKAGGWKAPAKNGVRGSIYADDHGLSAVSWHGAVYLR